MPHFFPESEKMLALKTIEKIPSEELVLLDKDFPEYTKPCLSVYQDFEKDIFDALDDAKDLLNDFDKLDHESLRHLD